MTDIKKVKPNGEYKSGKYEPKNPEKYIGDVHNIIYRSSWELRFCIYCDNNDGIVKWSSEPVVIPYYNPLDKKEHNYNVDFYIKVNKESSEDQEWLIEIKPKKQIQKPIFEGITTLPKLKSYNRNMQIWITNQAKFKAAREWCDKRGYKFGLIDENFLFKGK